MGEREDVLQREGALTFARIVELQRDPVDGNFDVAHLREIHHRIFQDLPHYMPGEFRAPAPMHIKMRALEMSPREYQVHYAGRDVVDRELVPFLEQLGGAGGFRELSAEGFAERMAATYAALDWYHPFTEGNSRTLRTFTAQLAREAGFTLDWGAACADGLTRDRLYIARDWEVIARAFPGLTMERAAVTPNRAEYEAYMRFVRHFSEHASLASLIRENVALSVPEHSRLQPAEMGKTYVGPIMHVDDRYVIQRVVDAGQAVDIRHERRQINAVAPELLRVGATPTVRYLFSNVGIATPAKEPLTKDGPADGYNRGRF